MKLLWQLVPVVLAVGGMFAWLHDTFGLRTWATEWFTEYLLSAVGG